MIYEDIKLYKELLKLLKICLNDFCICPYCGNDLRKQYECDKCDNDWIHSECFRQGKHKDDCLLEKHFALLEIDLIEI